MSYVTVVIPAAGQGKRMGTSGNKQFLQLQGRPLLVQTLEVFQNCPEVDDVILVAAAGEEEICRVLVEKHRLSKVRQVITGGKERQDSVNCGLAHLSSLCDLVAVHDGARPLLLVSELKEVIAAARDTGGAILAVPVKDTLKIADTAGLIARTPERSHIWAAQTPQVFKKEILLAAYRQAFQDHVYGTDDAFLVERLGFPVKLVRGSYENIKITTPEDLELAEMINKRRK